MGLITNQKINTNSKFHFYNHLNRYSKVVKAVLLLVVCVFFVKKSVANDSTINLTIEKNIATNCKNFEVDNMGNVYIITANNQIKKLNSNLDSVANFNNTKMLGNIASIDVSNPLKILVFYKNFSTIVVLDKLLSPINIIELQKQNLFSVAAVTASYDNNIWLFDEIDNKIKKVDNEGKPLLESIDFRFLFDYEKNFTVDYLKDIEGKLYLYNKQQGLLMFDYYAGLHNRYEVVGLSNLQIMNKQITALGKTGLEFHKLKTRTSKTYKINLDIKLIAKQKLYNKVVFVLFKDELNVYKINEE
jgi:hypothetical protein